jgi:hypothetical protein
VSVKDEKFIPLILNSDEQIVSYAEIEEKSILFVFPQLEIKSDFLIDLFQSKLPAIFPDLFPYSTAFAWLNEEVYRVPNETALLLEKERLATEYKANIQAIDEQILENYEKYHFLHDLLTQTGHQLVKAVENYFHWLGFEEVVNLDEVGEGLKEEDLQVITEQGLLVIEVKGIGGTSTDSDCAQINKIKYRRTKERGTFDVFALYIVNHMRYLPPLNRRNPPFSEQQIEDAKNEERGLLTTFELFKLYFFIDAGYITKEDARKALFDYRLVTFKPSNSISIGCPTEIFHNNKVGIFIIKNISIRLGGEVLIFADGNYVKAQIIGIQVNDVDVDEVSDGEVGLKFSTEITKKSEIWVLNKS